MSVASLDYTSKFCLISYTGLILHSTTMATSSHSILEGTMRVLCSYCMRSSFSAFLNSSESLYPHSTLKGTATCSSHCGTA